MPRIERILLLPSALLLLAAVGFICVSLFFNVWTDNSDDFPQKQKLWDCGDDIERACFVLCWGIAGQVIALLNLLFAIPASRPKQAELAHFRTAAVSMYPLGSLIAGCVLIGRNESNCGYNVGVGFVCLFIATALQLCAIVVNYSAAVCIRRKYKPRYNEHLSCFTFTVPY